MSLDDSEVGDLVQWLKGSSWKPKCQDGAMTAIKRSLVDKPEAEFAS